MTPASTQAKARGGKTVHNKTPAPKARAENPRAFLVQYIATTSSLLLSYAYCATVVHTLYWIKRKTERKKYS